MPIYEYRCRQCQHAFEALIWSEAEEATLHCPKCTSKEVERILSAFSRSGGLGNRTTSGCGPGSGGFS